MIPLSAGVTVNSYLHVILRNVARALPQYPEPHSLEPLFSWDASKRRVKALEDI